MGNELTASHFRVAAIAVALYDALWTIPAEIAIYREQKSLRRMTRACILFVLIRYVSAITIIVSNVGFFSHSFTEAACRKFYVASPIMKAVQATVSQVIVGIRTMAVGRNLTWVRWTVGILFVLTVLLEFFANLYRRIPFQGVFRDSMGSCTSGNDRFKIVWVHYLAAMIYDATCLSIASGIIYFQNRQLPEHTMDNLSKMLIKEGLVYFTWLTAANILNMILYLHNSFELQSSGATIGYAGTWIMSQRLLIHLHEYKTSSRHDYIHGLTHSRPASIQFVGPLSTSTSLGGDHIELSARPSIDESREDDEDLESGKGRRGEQLGNKVRLEQQSRRTSVKR